MFVNKINNLQIRKGLVKNIRLHENTPKKYFVIRPILKNWFISENY